MTTNTTRREQMRAKWLKLAALGMQTRAQPKQAPSGRFQHFRDAADEQRHLDHVQKTRAETQF